MPQFTLPHTPRTSAAAPEDYILQLALERGRLQPADLDAARAAADAEPCSRASAPRLLEILAQTGRLTPKGIAKMLAAEFRLDVAPDLRDARAPAELLELVPRAWAERHGLVPLSRDAGTLFVAVANPCDATALDFLAERCGGRVEACVSTPGDIADAIERLYPKTYDSPDGYIDALTAGEPAPEFVAPTSPPALEAEDDAPIVALVQRIIDDAVRRRASDIHLEPLENRFRVRYRIDGVLLEVENPPKRLQLPIVSRIKIMAHISIAEKRVPQDGRIRIEAGGRQLDLRVSSLPTSHGESIVMRILDKEGLALGLPELGFFPDDAAAFEKLVSLPEGLVLVTGPTGSGKTTTLYACLHHLNRSDRKIITVEDPVEYQLAGINQVPVREEVGMTFASALRAMLRQAPNIVMVGEVRDRETAEIAINASLTGHMVFSTLHTNDAPGAVARLVDLGVKPFLVSSAVRAVLAQRLVRKTCRRCTRKYIPDTRELRALGLASVPEGANCAQGAGCAECNGTGFRGRMGIFELLVLDEPMQRLIHDRAGVSILREKARANGMRTMREDGVRKALAGLTTFEEVASLTVEEESR